MGVRAAEHTESRFVAYVEKLVKVIGHADRAGPLRDYCTGLVNLLQTVTSASPRPARNPHEIRTSCEIDCRKQQPSFRMCS
jgi:SRSO17 transposase